MDRRTGVVACLRWIVPTSIDTAWSRMYVAQQDIFLILSKKVTAP